MPAGKNDAKSSGASYASSYIEDKELEEIFLREFGSKKTAGRPIQGGTGKESSVPKRKRRAGGRTTGAGTSAGRKGTTTSGVRSASRAETSKYSGNAGMLSGRNEEKQYLLWTATISSLPGIF